MINRSRRAASISRRSVRPTDRWGQALAVAGSAKELCGAHMAWLGHIHQGRRGMDHQLKADSLSVAGAGEAGEVCSPEEPYSAMAWW